MTRRRSLRDRSCCFSIFARLLTRGIGAEREAETWGVAPRSLPCPPVDLAHSLRQLLGMQTAAAFGAAVDQACGTNVALGPAVATHSHLASRPRPDPARRSTRQRPNLRPIMIAAACCW